MARILIVDNSPPVVQLLGAILKVEGHEVESVLDSGKAIDLLRKQAFDLLICEVGMSGVDGIQLLKQARAADPALAVIMLALHGSVQTAAESMKYGAYDYVVKPFRVEEMQLIVRRALAHRASESQAVAAADLLWLDRHLEDVVALSPSMVDVFKMAVRVAPTDATVLIFGEDGVGKETVARAIHTCSRRSGKPYQSVNCAAFPGSVIDDVIFAKDESAGPADLAPHVGVFESARGGTLFVDQIGELPLKVQEKLVRAIRDGEAAQKEMGGKGSEAFCVPRLLAAASGSLAPAVEAGRFLPELHARLCAITISIAPLRERRADILSLAAHFLKKAYAGGGRYTLAPDAQAAIEGYTWPGNVRELEHAIRHAIMFSQSAVITAGDLPPSIRNIAASSTARQVMGEDFRGEALKAFLKSKKSDYVSGR
jgi:DNA-binding NtrC family response regulator